MGTSSSLFSLTVGRKILMGLTGLFLVSFLFVHLAGNFALYSNDGGEAFNLYSRFMSTNVIIRIFEIVLVAGFLGHIYLSVILTRRNKAARPIGYQVNNVQQTSSIYSRNMGITGTIILVFLIIHLKTFWYEYKFGEVEMANYDGVELKDMYLMVKVAFQEWWYSALYVVAMILLGAHLNHGFQSAFKSLGLSNKKYGPAISTIGTALAIVFAAGFASFPILFYFGCVGN